MVVAYYVEPDSQVGEEIHHFVFRDGNEIIDLRVKRHMYKDTIIDVEFYTVEKISREAKGWKVDFYRDTVRIIIIDEERTEKLIRELYRKLKSYYEKVKKMERKYHHKAIEIGKRIASEVGMELDFFS